MTAFSVTLPSGEAWTPTFVQTLNEDKCIGCGRCFNVCPRGVLELVGLNDEGERIHVDMDDDDADEEYERRS
jgi:Nif-specific ferredoxin III